jgi:AmmeMemoRadiSam system protein A
MEDSLLPLHETVRRMSVESATADPRFPAVAAAELKEIEIEISALTTAEPISGPAEFQVGRDGIIIRKGGSGAVFLPQVAPEQGWDRDQTLTHLCRKAGLPGEEWKKPGMKFFTFTAQVFDEGMLKK